MKFIKFKPNEKFQAKHACPAGGIDGIEVDGGYEVVLPERTGPQGWPVCPVVIVTEIDGVIEHVSG